MKSGYPLPIDVQCHIGSACAGNYAQFFREHGKILGVCQRTFYKAVNGDPVSEDVVQRFEDFCESTGISGRFQADIDYIRTMIKSLDEMVVEFKNNGASPALTGLISKYLLYYIGARNKIDKSLQRIIYRHQVITGEQRDTGLHKYDLPEHLSGTAGEEIL
jgi:hypothetical protein